MVALTSTPLIPTVTLALMINITSLKYLDLNEFDSDKWKDATDV